MQFRADLAVHCGQHKLLLLLRLLLLLLSAASDSQTLQLVNVSAYRRYRRPRHRKSLMKIRTSSRQWHLFLASLFLTPGIYTTWGIKNNNNNN